MNKISTILAAVLAGTFLSAQAKPMVFDSINWSSQNKSQAITIYGENGSKVFINVAPDSAGIDVKNCDATSHVPAGSAAVCFVQNGQAISFSSDSTTPAWGSYQVE